MRNIFSLSSGIVFSVFIWLNPSSATAEIYKWVDEKGNVHYGDKPTSKGKPIDVSEAAAKTGNRPAQDREERRRRLLQAMDEDRLDKKTREAREKKQKAQHRAQCVNAKDRLRRYEQAGSLYDLDKDGNRITLSNERRARATNKLRASIKKYCK